MLCWFFRLMISDAADSDKGIGPWTHRHMEGCAGCRRFHRQCDMLAKGLRSETTWLPATNRADIHRIGRRLPRRPIWAGLAAAACIALVALAGLTFLDRQPASVSPPLPPTFAVAALKMDLTTVWTRALDTPLIVEAQHLSEDAQSGIRFLVSCLSIGRFETFADGQIEQSAPPL